MTWHRGQPTRLSLSAAVIATFMGCGGAQQRSDSQLLDAQRERDALRVAYEAQQLKLKELSERVIALEDRVMLSAAPKSSGRGSGLWGRPLTARVPAGLPVVKLSEMGSQPRREARGSRLIKTQRPQSAPPSAQEMRDERLQEAGERLDDVPTLTADNIKGYQRARRELNSGASAVEKPVESPVTERRAKRKRPRRAHPAPEGSERAASLGVVPVPPRPREVSAEVEPANDAPESATQGELQSEPQGLPRGEPLSARADQDPFGEALRVAQTALLGAKWAEARRSFEQVLSLSPKAEERSSARYGIARVLQGQGRPLEAIDTLKSLIQADPSGRLVPSALLLIGELQLSAGQGAQGRATLSRLKSLYPNTSAARRAEGLLQ